MKNPDLIKSKTSSQSDHDCEAFFTSEKRDTPFLPPFFGKKHA
jgi:hypothetical protein